MNKRETSRAENSDRDVLRIMVSRNACRRRSGRADVRVHVHVHAHTRVYARVGGESPRGCACRCAQSGFLRNGFIRECLESLEWCTGRLGGLLGQTLPANFTSFFFCVFFFYNVSKLHVGESVQGVDTRRAREDKPYNLVSSVVAQYRSYRFSLSNYDCLHSVIVSRER